MGKLRISSVFLLLLHCALATVDNDPECGRTKGCFSECQGDACEFLVSWQEEGEYGLYTLATQVQSSTAAWMALGFSDDQLMGADSVSGCAFGSDGVIRVFSAQNVDKTPNVFEDDEVTLTASSLVGTTLTCTIRRKISPEGNRVDISQLWNLLFARGPSPTISSGKVQALSYHGPENRFASATKLRVSDTGTAGAEDIKFPLIKAHGCLMIIAWIFFASMGIILARYFKPVWVELMFSQKVWFQFHRTCMIFAFLCTAIGFALIFVEVKGWSELEGEKEYLKGHPIMGVIVTALTVINPLMALIRPHPDTPKRPIFNWAHWGVGTAAHVLGVVTIFFGTQLGRADAPDYIIYILAGYVAWQVLVEVVFICLTGYREHEASITKYQKDDFGVGRSVSTYKKLNEQKGDLMKKFVLVMHFLVVSGLTAVLVAVVAVGKKELDD